MAMRRVTRVLHVLALSAVLLSAGTQTSDAHAPGTNGWGDPHTGWPARPSGLTQINNVFGARCQQGVSNAETYQWYSFSDQKYYPVHFHDRLGTRGNVISQNLNNNVAGHHAYSGTHHDVTHGIYGFACRQVSGSSKWSVHAWGIAVDTDSATSPYKCGAPHTITGAQRQIWESHGWHWGGNFCDYMHFQYATDY